MIAGRYELEREVGRGGMGAVWLARDEVLGRHVAIKRVGMVPGGASPDLERAEREARLAARLNHPHVVAVFDLVTDPEGQWLVMEYVEGVTLSGLVQRDGRLSPQEASPLIEQAADALAAAHAAGIVHRDVKPSNILVTPAGDVKLSDFGIARAEADASLTQTGLVTGSPAYLAPEVASGQSATDASDVWSLGATLFHALAGHPPYEVGDNLMGALYKIVHEEPPRLHDAGWLGPLLEATMTRDPADRWPMSRVRDYLAAGPAGTTITPEPTTVAVPTAGAESTSVLPAETARARAAAPPVPADPTPAPSPAPPAPATSPRRSRTPALLIGLGVALLLVLLLVAYQLVTAGDDAAPPAADPGSSGDATGGSGPSGGETTEPSPPADRPTAAGMEDFVSSYLATAPEDPSTTFQQLTPAFQRASGGIDSYSGYWNTIATAEPVSISADPDSLTVSYTVAYVREDGSETTDDVTLQLVYEDGEYLIDQEG